MEAERRFDLSPLEPMFYVGLYLWVKKNPLSKAAEKIAELLGGADFGNYKEKLGQISANKGNHAKRSIANSPVHLKWWKKQKKKKP